MTDRLSRRSTTFKGVIDESRQGVVLNVWLFRWSGFQGGRQSFVVYRLPTTVRSPQTSSELRERRPRSHGYLTHSGVSVGVTRTRAVGVDDDGSERCPRTGFPRGVYFQRFTKEPFDWISWSTHWHPFKEFNRHKRRIPGLVTYRVRSVRYKKNLYLYCKWNIPHTRLIYTIHSPRTVPSSQTVSSPEL